MIQFSSNAHTSLELQMQWSVKKLEIKLRSHEENLLKKMFMLISGKQQDKKFWSQENSWCPSFCSI